VVVEEAALGLGFRGSRVWGPPCPTNLEREEVGGAGGSAVAAV
jgi:hypothetical protein